MKYKALSVLDDFCFYETVLMKTQRVIFQDSVALTQRGNAHDKGDKEADDRIGPTIRPNHGRKCTRKDIVIGTWQGWHIPTSRWEAATHWYDGNRHETASIKHHCLRRLFSTEEETVEYRNTNLSPLTSQGTDIPKERAKTAQYEICPPNPPKFYYQRSCVAGIQHNEEPRKRTTASLTGCRNTPWLDNRMEFTLQVPTYEFTRLGEDDPLHGRPIRVINGTKKGRPGHYLEKINKQHRLQVRRPDGRWETATLLPPSFMIQDTDGRFKKLEELATEPPMRNPRPPSNGEHDAPRRNNQDPPSEIPAGFRGSFRPNRARGSTPRPLPSRSTPTHIPQRGPRPDEPIRVDVRWEDGTTTAETVLPPGVARPIGTPNDGNSPRTESMPSVAINDTVDFAIDALILAMDRTHVLDVEEVIATLRRRYYQWTEDESASDGVTEVSWATESMAPNRAPQG